MAKLRGPQCESKIQLLFHAHDTKVSLYQTDTVHTHEIINENSKKQGIPEETKKLIELFIKRGQSTAMIITDQLEQWSIE